MLQTQKQDRGIVDVNAGECKGCGLCVEACPGQLLQMSPGLNHFGYHTAVYAGSGCTACGICYLVCPEPGALAVYRLGAHAASALAPANSTVAASGGVA